MSLIWTGDESNRYWQGKAIGGAVAILGVILIFFGIIAVGAYSKNRSLNDTRVALKEASLALLLADWKKKAPKKKR